jgi:hypothetical protein
MKEPPELPPIETHVENVDESGAFIPCEGYSICEWHPERDGKGKPTAVVLRLPVELPDLPRFEFALRLKSADAVNTLIKALARHRLSVWGE